MSSLKIFNIGFDEDGLYLKDEGKLDEYKWRGYICEKGGMSGILKDYDKDIKDSKVGGVNDEWFNGDGKEEWGKFEKGYEKFKELKEEFGGVVIGWSVECDDNWILIYDENNKDVEEEVEVWFNREYDESEFEDE
jgi:hypothetical protein